MDRLGNLDSIDLASRITKDLLIDVVVKKGIAYLCLSIKLTPAGWVADLISKVVFYFVDKYYPFLIKFIKVTDLKFENEIHQKSYERASLKLKIIASRSGINSDEFKNERKIEHDKQSDLVIFNIQYS